MEECVVLEWGVFSERWVNSQREWCVLRERCEFSERRVCSQREG